jgi:hypothetical protein
LRRCATVSLEPEERPFRLREEWMAVLFVSIVILAAVGSGILLLFGV